MNTVCYEGVCDEHGLL